MSTTLAQERRSSHGLGRAKTNRNKSLIGDIFVAQLSKAFSHGIEDEEAGGVTLPEQLVRTKRETLEIAHFHEDIFTKRYLHDFIDSEMVLLKGNSTEASGQFRNSESPKVEEANVNEVLKDLIKIMFTHEPKSVAGSSIYQYDSESSLARSAASGPQITEQDITDVITSLYGCSEKVSNYIKKGTIKQPNELFHEYIQGYELSKNGKVTHNGKWIVVCATTKKVQKRKVGIARLETPLKLTGSANEVKFIILVLVPYKSAKLHSSVEVARAFGTLFKNSNFLERLENAENVENFMSFFEEETHNRIEYDEHHRKPIDDHHHAHHSHKPDWDSYGEYFHAANNFPWYVPGKGIFIDFRRRISHYFKDYLDVFDSKSDGDVKRRKYGHLREFIKMVRGILFVAVGVVLPVMAFGVANQFNTAKNCDYAKSTDYDSHVTHRASAEESTTCGSYISLENTMLGQVIAGVIFGLFSSQPLGLVMTTPPITLLMTLLYKISKSWEVEFLQFYGITGIFIGCWLILFSLMNASRALKWVTPSVEEIFAVFTAWAFLNEAITNTNTVREEWWKPAVTHLPDINQTESFNYTEISGFETEGQREKFLAWVILMIMTSLIGFFLLNTLKTTPYLNHHIRNIFADYSLLIAVIISTLVYNFGLNDIDFAPYHLEWNGLNLKVWSYFKEELDGSKYTNLTAETTLVALGTSIPLALLFFLDQGFCSIVTNSHKNSLEKPGGFHADLFLVGVINIIMSIFGMPWCHLALPHSDWHVAAVSETRLEAQDGENILVIKKGTVKEQRVSNLLGHALIGILLIPDLFKAILVNIPIPVLDGVFIFFAFASLIGNKVVARWLLIFTDSSAYSNTSYLKKVPILKIHIFSIVCFIEAVLLIFVGFYTNKYAKFGFPFIVIAMMPIRHFLLPMFINVKNRDRASSLQIGFSSSFIDILDGPHWPGCLVKSLSKSKMPKEVLADLLKNQKLKNFKESELKVWYDGFREDCPNGKMSKAQFVEMYESGGSSAEIIATRRNSVSSNHNKRRRGSIVSASVLDTVPEVSRSGVQNSSYTGSSPETDNSEPNLAKKAHISHGTSSRASIIRQPSDQRDSIKAFAGTVFDLMDDDKDGIMDFEEFMSAISVLVKGSRKDKLRWIFDLYDGDKSGKIDLEELTKVLELVESMKSPINNVQSQTVKEKAQAMMTRLDSDRNGVLDFEEFLKGATEDPTIIRSLAYNKYDGLK